jgi:hypothetical protein
VRVGERAPKAMCGRARAVNNGRVQGQLSQRGVAGIHGELERGGGEAPAAIGDGFR